MNGEPLAFSITEMAGASDCYSYLDMTSDELSAKGSGGTRMMHSYVSLDHEDSITTPPEDYVPDKVGEDSMEKLQQQRAEEVPRPIART